MSRIINPNAPPTTSALEQIIGTMQIIARYRKSFFDLEVCKQSEGVLEPLTAKQVMDVENEQQRLMKDMVRFILYGEHNYERNTSDIKRIITSPEKTTKDNAQRAQGVFDPSGTHHVK